MNLIAHYVENALEIAGMYQRSGDPRFQAIDFECQHLADRLSTLAKIGPLSADDVIDADKWVKESNMREITKLQKTFKKCREISDDLRVFYVYNKSNKCLAILAIDVECALFYAKLKHHIHSTKNGRVGIMGREEEAAIRKSGEALGRALRDGYPGVISFVGNNVVNEEFQKVYTPMTIVK